MSYKMLTVEKDGEFIAMGISNDGKHSFTVGRYPTRRAARFALDELMTRDQSLQIVKRLNRRVELPPLAAVCEA